MDEDHLRNSLENIRIKIGSAASAIVGSPELNTSKLKDLIRLLDRTRFDIFNEVEHKNTVVALHQLVASTACEIFKDIIPSYRIKADNSDENAKQKKQTIQLRQYERIFCTLYKTYLQRLERMLDSLRKSSTSTFYRNLIKTDLNDRVSMAQVALSCFGELIVEHPHFNFRDQILKKLVEFSAQTRFIECSRIATESLSKALIQDKLGEVSLEITRLICDLVKKRKLSLSTYIFETLLNLRLIDVKMADKEIKEKKKEEKERLNSMNKKLSRKERKRNKKMKKLKKDLSETEAHSSVDQKLKYHRLILKKLFVTYFRLLRFHEELDGEEKETQKFIKLLPPVLEGVKKFSHLIDIALCNDIFPFIRRLLQNKTLTTNCMLHCLSTVFVLYKSLESELEKVDPESFYKQFYLILTNVKPYAITKDEFSSLMNCIELVIVKRARHISNQRYAAFVRRLLTISLYIPNDFVVDLLSAVRTMILQQPNSLALLDSTNCSNFGTGEYDMLIEDPDHCHADSSVCWELHLLQKHHEPAIRDYANFFVKDLLTNS